MMLPPDVCCCARPLPCGCQVADSPLAFTIGQQGCHSCTALTSDRKARAVGYIQESISAFFRTLAHVLALTLCSVSDPLLGTLHHNAPQMLRRACTHTQLVHTRDQCSLHRLGTRLVTSEGMG